MIARRTFIKSSLPAILISGSAGSQPVGVEATKIDADQIRQTLAIGAFTLLTSRLAAKNGHTAD